MNKSVLTPKQQQIFSMLICEKLDQLEKVSQQRKDAAWMIAMYEIRKIRMRR
jgi:hypothetical protein